MIDVGAAGLATLLCVAALCTAGGLAISRCLPWSRPAVEVRLPIAVGVALGPFLFGMVAVLVLGLLSGATHLVHLVAVFLALGAILATALFFGRGGSRWHGPTRQPINPAEFVLGLAWAICGLAVLFISIFTPLTQNDSLEYATVGRILFETRSLWSYPVLDPEINASGFFGPWTHPPLYVSSIYLTSIIQGHADAPGAMRLISPWFLITSSAVVFSIGALISRPTGLAAAIFFLSTPLLFLGAGSALLDALYVSGFALLVAMMVGIEARPLLRGAIVGAMTGIGLWTHSVAILLIPLMLGGLALCRGLTGIRRFVPEAAAAIAAAIVVGGWHYARNIVLFGTPISDNPAVFALPELHWDDYFLINRGLGTTVSMIQYGLLKGWFAPEAFGITYWAMLVGFAIMLIVGLRSRIWTSIWQGALVHERGTLSLHLSLGLFVVYTLGAIISVGLGMDIMVKNERYVLVIQAVVALGAAYGFVAVLDALSSVKFGFVVRALGISCFVAGALMQVFVFTSYAVARNGQTFATIGEQAFPETLASVGEYKLTDHLRHATPEDALVFSVKPADMYYAERRMVSYLDERLLPFYRETNPAIALQMLRQLGITHVHVPDYGIPPLYNSTLHEILRSPTLSDLLISTDRGQVYALRPDDKSGGQPIDVSPSERVWTSEQSFFLGGRRRLTAAATGDATIFAGPTSIARSTYGLYQRNIITLLRIGARPDEVDRRLIAIEAGGEYAVDVTLSGDGLVGLLVNQHEASGTDGVGLWLGTTRLASFELSPKQEVRVFRRRFIASERARWLSVAIEHIGASTVTIDRIELVKID